jgi:hypothetical protein
MTVPRLALGVGCVLLAVAAQTTTKNPLDPDGDKVPNRFDFCPFTSRGMARAVPVAACVVSCRVAQRHT